MHITFVKKVLRNGALCSQCNAVFKQLIDDGLIDQINHVAIADARDNGSFGMVLAEKYHVKQVPFFVIEDLSQRSQGTRTDITVFDVYSEFKQFLNQRSINT